MTPVKKLTSDEWIATPQARASRARNLFFIGIIIPCFSVADYFIIGSFSWVAISIRTIWTMAFLISAITTIKGSPALLKPVIAAACLINGVSLSWIIMLHGGTDSPLMGWQIAMPLLVALVLPDDEFTSGITGVVCTAGTVLVLINENAAWIDIAIWTSMVATSGLLSVYGVIRFIKQRNLALEAQWDCAQAEHALEVSEQRRFDADKLAHTQQLATIGALAAGVTHELSNPMYCITGNLELLRDTTAKSRLDPDQRELVQEIEDAADSILFIIRDLKAAAYKQTGGSESCDASQTINDAVRLSRFKWRGTTEIMVNTDSPLPRVTINSNRLNQVIINLIINACDAIDTIRRTIKKPKIVISAVQDADEVRITVDDNGPGFDINEIDNMFEAFITTKSSEKGTGLGLALCRTYIEEVGGDISADKSPLGGARISFSLLAIQD